MREFIALPILQSNEDVVVFGEGFDFAPKFGLVQDGMLFHDLDMGEFQFKSGVRGGVPFVDVESMACRLEEANLLLDVGNVHVSFKL